MDLQENEVDPSDIYSKLSLHIGDFIILRRAKPYHGWLAAEGLLDDECFVTEDNENFDNCVWEIHVQNQYSAAREYKDALAQSLEYKDVNISSRERIKRISSQEDSTRNKHTTKSKISKEQLNQLQRAAINEQRLNDKLMSAKIGKAVAFGDLIQLRHVKSNKFLTVSTSILAREERENMRVSIDSDGDSLSCLAFVPRYKFDKEGKVISSHSEVLLRVHERPGEFLHVADLLSGSAKREVNCSLESTLWTVQLYQRVADLKSRMIMGGQLVTLQDSDGLSCLTVERKKKTDSTESKDPIRVIMSPPVQLNGLEAGKGTNYLWLLEKVTNTIGGPIAIGVDAVTLRDLNSGLYLHVEDHQVQVVEGRENASVIELFFSPQSVNTNNAFLQENSSVQLSFGDVWLGVGQTELDHHGRCVLRFDRSAANSLQLSGYIAKKLGIQVNVGVQATTHLKKLAKQCADSQSGASNLRDFTMSVRETALLLENVCSFLIASDSVIVDDVSESLYTKNKDLIVTRQNIAREQGLIDAVLDILEYVEKRCFDIIQAQPISTANSRPKVSTRRSLVLKNDNEANTSVVEDDELNGHIKAPAHVKRRGSAQLFVSGTESKQGKDNSYIGMVNLANHSPDFPNNELEVNDATIVSPSSMLGNNPSVNSNNSKGNLPAPFRRRRSAMLAKEKPNAKEMMLVRRLSTNINYSNIFNTDDSDQMTDFMDSSAEVSTVSQQIAGKCLKVLLCLIMGNAENQLIVADRFPVVLNQITTQRLAVLCVEEMLRENLTILRTKVRRREIDIFVNLLSESEMSVTYLRLIQSTCSCPRGVDATQRMVTYALFGKSDFALDSRNVSKKNGLAVAGHVQDAMIPPASVDLTPTTRKKTDEMNAVASDLMIKLVADRRKLVPVEWPDLSIYCPTDPWSHVLGYKELRGGLPELFLQWDDKKNGESKFGMHALFGFQDRVPFGIICTAKHAGGANKDSFVDPYIAANIHKQRTTLSKKRHQHDDKVQVMKAQVADFFNTQLYLVADLCLDRNYVAISILEKLYEYDVLIAILRSNLQVPNRFKAAVCRVLRCLYVDREPQTASIFPRYIRTSVSLSNEATESNGGKYDYTDAGEDFHGQNKFALIQQIISQHIHEHLDPTSCDEFTAELIDLLHALVNFGFYTTVPQILDVLKPLIRFLDHHQKSYQKRESSVGDSKLNLSKSAMGWISQGLSVQSAQVSPIEHLSPTSEHSNRVDESTENETSFVSTAKRLLAFTDTILWMVAMFCLVIISVTIAFVQMFSSYELEGFFIATTSIFAAEWFTRLLLYSVVNRRVTTFFFDPFNILDILLVVFDISVLSVGTSTLSVGRVARTLRILRILRVARLFRAAALLKRIAEKTQNQFVYIPPKRYQNIRKIEAKTIVGILKVLLMFYDRIQDKNLDLAIKAFAIWCKESKHRACNPVELFHNLLASDESISSELSSKFDSVLLDAVMYSDVSLTQEALQLLMVHKSQNDQFFNIAENIQIVYSPRIEGICKSLQEMLRELKRLAEMFEIWSTLETDSDIASARRANNILLSIKGYIAKKNEDRSLGIRSMILADEEVQNLLRNLDAMTQFMVLLDALFDGDGESLKPEIAVIMRNCCDLICWFLKNSEANQAIAFKYLDWFISRVDDGIGSSTVIRNILEGNPVLIKQCPRRYLNEFAQKIISKGHNPDYLDLFVGVTQYTELSGVHISSIEAEVASYLTSREWKKHLLLWCAPYQSAEYQERKEVMERAAAELLEIKNTRNSSGNAHFEYEQITEELLSPQLRYHIKILTLLSSCNLGPKLHAVYPVHDILHAMLDVSTVFPVKKHLGYLLIQAVKNSIDRIEKSELFWQLLEQMAKDLEGLPNEFVQLSRDPTLRIQRGEWVEIIASVTASFFDLFDYQSYHEYRQDKGNSSNLPLDPRMTIQQLYEAAKTLIDYHSGKLGSVLTEELTFAAVILLNHLEEDYAENAVALVGSGFQDLQSYPAINLNETRLKLIKMQHQRSSIIFADVQQLMFRKQFKVFMRAIKASVKDSRHETIALLESIPWTSEHVDSDVRFEPFLRKLGSHFRSMLKRSNSGKILQDNAVVTCQWILRALRHLLEKHLKVSCDHFYDIDTSDLQDSQQIQRLRDAYNDNGITLLCIDLIAIGVDHTVCLEAMKLLFILLLKSGGCLEIQKTVYAFLAETDSVLFFELCHEMIENLKSWHSKENESLSESQGSKSSGNTDVPEDIIILHLLQALCEGSFPSNRDVIRDQSNNTKTINIFSTLASYLGVLSQGENITNTYVATILLRTILRLIQGPCRPSQELFVLHTELLISLNRLIRSARPSVSEISDIWQEYLELLKEGVVEVIHGLLEGQAQSSLVYDRVSSTIDLGVLQLLILPQVTPDILLVEDNKSASRAQAKFLVLAKTLGRATAMEVSPIVSKELSIATVEVVWKERVETIHFAVPEFVADLPNNVAEELSAEMEEATSRELKLLEFIKRCKVLYQQSVHQQWLKEYGLANLLNAKYYLSRAMFVNALIMNGLILAFYGTKLKHKIYYGGIAHRELAAASGDSSSKGINDVADELYIHDGPSIAIFVLNIVQALAAFVALLIICTAYLPVQFSARKETANSAILAALQTCFDVVPIWALVYCGITVIGLLYNRLFLSLLLLDWIALDPITQDLLLAIHYPIRQLVATLVILLICLNIFAGLVFTLYRHDIITVRVFDMWDTLKLCISYGFRGEYGVDHEMEPTLGPRMVVDVVFYFIILSILRHTFFAIIVDTFGKLRELKFEREMEHRNTCFICGIERHEYERAGNSSNDNSFNHHREMTHNPANYAFFIMSIWHQQQSDDNSLEIFVRHCLKNKDLSWFPSGLHSQSHGGHSHVGHKSKHHQHQQHSPEDAHPHQSDQSTKLHVLHDDHDRQYPYEMTNTATATLITIDSANTKKQTHGHDAKDNAFQQLQDQQSDVIEKVNAIQRQLQKLTKIMAIGNEQSPMLARRLSGKFHMQSSFDASLHQESANYSDNEHHGNSSPQVQRQRKPANTRLALAHEATPMTTQVEFNQSDAVNQMQSNFEEEKEKNLANSIELIMRRLDQMEQKITVQQTNNMRQEEQKKSDANEKEQSVVIKKEKSRRSQQRDEVKSEEVHEQTNAISQEPAENRKEPQITGPSAAMLPSIVLQQQKKRQLAQASESPQDKTESHRGKSKTKSKEKRPHSAHPSQSPSRNTAENQLRVRPDSAGGERNLSKSLKEIVSDQQHHLQVHLSRLNHEAWTEVDSGEK